MNRRVATRPWLEISLLAVSAVLAASGCRSDGLISGGPPPSGMEPPGNGSNNPPPGMNNPPANNPPGSNSNPIMTPARPSPGVVSGMEMPAEVLALLQGRCAGCHTYGQADPAGWGSVLDVSRMIASDIVVPGDPNASRLIDRVAVAGDMPPRGERLNAAEVDLLKKWITNLARPAGAILTDDDVLDAISVDQLRLRDRSADYRYVSFAHFAGEGRSAAELEATRSVFVFVLNSLSRRGNLVDVETIDDQKTIFRLRLSDLGWNEALWDTLTGFYPYCLKSDSVAHEGLYAQLRTEAPVVRGDWFLATATKAPLYDLLVNLPDTVDDLAAQLGIDINDDINHPGLAEPDNLLRVGFRKSGVALHNRLLERHLGNQGQYLWISYDFDSNEGRADLMENPLGPADRDEQNFVKTFQHAGGEVIYTLPNGLQGYMLVDAVGRKIAEAPIQIVRDPRRSNGVVENGISCFGCHGNVGMIRPRETDEVPRYAETHIAQFLGRELNEIESSYPRVLRPDPFVLDANRYRSIADTLVGGGPPKGQSEYSEFVALVGQYEGNVGFRGAAAEFGEEYASFRERVLANDFQNDDLPRTPTAPLVLRDDFVCVFRDLVTKVRPNAIFCEKTFDNPAVVNSCSGSSSTRPQTRPQPAPGGGSGGSGGRSGGSGGAGGAGGSSNSGGSGGSSSSSADAGASDTRCVRRDGRLVCR